MQLKALCVLCLLVCAHAFAVQDFTGSAPRSLLQGTRAVGKTSAKANSTPGTKAKAVSTASATQVGDGKVVVKSKAFSESNAKSQLVIAIRKAVSDVRTGADAIAIAKATANAFAEAIAEAYAEASVEIVSTSNGGTACGKAVGKARASAEASANALVDVLAAAANEIDFASASAAVEAIVSVTVDAFARAKANACVNGVGKASAVASQLSTACGIAYAEVIALALALVTPGAAVAKINVQAFGDSLVVATVDGRTATKVVGDAKAKAVARGSAGGER